MKPFKFTISRKDFIGQPYTFCPKCHQNTFGVWIGAGSENSYDKECKNCGHQARFPLPEIRKRIIYLDQFVIDNIVKSLDPKHPKHEAVLKESFWLEVYKRLDVLVRAQLVVCPDSFFHRDESGPTGYFKSMERIYEHLSGGVTFHPAFKITEAQICEHFRNYLRGAPEMLPSTLPENITFEDFHKWHGRLRVSVSMKPRDEEVKEKIESKRKTYASFLAIFERWKTEASKKFEDWYWEETKGFADGTLGAIRAFGERRAKAPEKYARDGKIDLDDWMPPPSMGLIEAMMWAARQEKMTDPAEIMKKIGEYLFSKELEKIPAVRIGSLLYAGLADQAVRGRVQPPSPGVLVDVEMIASLLPYCEAIFLDKENAALLEDGRIKQKLGVATRIFSLRDKDGFLKYLDEILAGANPQHLEFVEQAYGAGWKNPYASILSRSDV